MRGTGAIRICTAAEGEEEERKAERVPASEGKAHRSGQPISEAEERRAGLGGFEEGCAASQVLPSSEFGGLPSFPQGRVSASTRQVSPCKRPSLPVRDARQ